MDGWMDGWVDGWMSGWVGVDVGGCGGCKVSNTPLFFKEA